MADSHRLFSPRDWRRSTRHMLIVLLATGCVLRLLGRVFWCSCGSPIPWSWDINTLHNSQHLVDPYFFTHVLHGLMFYAPLSWLSRRVSPQCRFWMAVLIEAFWEIQENSPLVIDRYRSVTISLGYYGDSIANSMIDILACAAGYMIASRAKVWQSLLLFFGTELGLAILIRDGLLLNILMLVCPVDSVLQWQQGN